MNALNFFPKLTQALGGSAFTLLKGIPFDDIQATQGDEAARRFLQAFETDKRERAA